METVSGNAPESPKPAVQSQLPSPHALAKKKRKELFKKLVSAAILIFMVGWVFAAYYGMGSDDTNTDENIISVQGYDFYQLQDSTFGTYLNIGGKKVPIAFRLDPRNASSIGFYESVVQQILSAQKVYITFDPNTEDKAKMAVATAEIARITSLYNLETVGAYIKDSDPPSPNVPIRTCDDVQEFTTVIQLGIDNSTDTNIKNENGCITVFGKTADELINAADKLGMNLIGIKL